MHERILKIVDDVSKQLEHSQSIHPPIRGFHEGYAVLLEEMDELWDAIKKDEPHMARREALHVAATAIRLIFDLY